jgi:hypothetical protein
LGEENVAEMLACSSSVKVHGKLMGIDTVRWAIMKTTLGLTESDGKPACPTDVEHGKIRKVKGDLSASTPTTKRIVVRKTDTVVA